MKEPIVRIENLSHTYGRGWAIRHINFDISKNGVLGLLGSNGAGKSTTMNIMCGVLNQTEGRVLINGIDIRQHPEEAKRNIGFLPQSAPLYLDLTVDEYLKYCAHLRKIPKRQLRTALEEAKERCGISHFSSRLLRNLSGGYRQRVGIAQAIIHKPRLVVMDEPTNGLDPNQIHEVRRLIRDIAVDRSVIFSSHILSEIQATCQDIKMIERGELIFSDTIAAFNNYLAPRSLLLSLAVPPEVEALLRIPGIVQAESIEEGLYRLYFDDVSGIGERVAAACALAGWRLKELTLERSSPEEVFSQLSNPHKSR